MENEKLVILMPTFNDWSACGQVLATLDSVLSEHHIHADVLLVDDGSLLPVGDTFRGRTFLSFGRIDLLHLKVNLGHQRAIGVGLAYLEGHASCSAVIIMDSDGEDDPRDVPRLLDRHRFEASGPIVFAERTKRSESITFQLGYLLYKGIHRALTGYGVRVGNYSVVPRRALSALVVLPDLWNHYAASVFISGLTYCTVPTKRASRAYGKSKMNFVKLVTHGLRALSVFSELIGVRLMLVSLALMAAASTGIVAVVAIRLFTDLAIPGWATFTFGLLSVILLQASVLAVVFTFIILSNRRGATFLPARDYHLYIRQLTPAYESP